jgi:hypothetical protein
MVKGKNSIQLPIIAASMALLFTFVSSVSCLTPTDGVSQQEVDGLEADIQGQEFQLQLRERDLENAIFRIRQLEAELTELRNTLDERHMEYLENINQCEADVGKARNTLDERHMEYLENINQCEADLQAEISELTTLTERLARDAEHKTTSDLDAEKKEDLLALADNRNAWFLTSEITTETLQGLYGSWSVVCQTGTSLGDYKRVVYDIVRPEFLESLGMKLDEVQKADRYYKLVTWTSPWAYVEQTWKIGEKIILGPAGMLYVLESDGWRYHDC